MKHFVQFLVAGLLTFSLAIIVGVAETSNITPSQNLNYQSTQVISRPLPTAVSSPQVIDVINPDQAGQTAIQAVGFSESLTKTPELVSFEGKVAYEVTLNNGYLTYVDAVTGSVLYNPLTGDATATVSSDQALQTASQYLKNSTIYGWGLVLYNQAPAYAIEFLNGDIVLVNPHGQVIYVQQVNPSSEREHVSDNH